jgi:hypothetical protein
MTFLKSNQVTVLDLDFTTQGTQTFSSNIVYTIGGYPFTKINSANETTASTLDSTGITFVPISATDYFTTVRTLPGLHLPLQKVIPSFRGDMGLRIWAYNSSNNAAANFDNAVMAMDTGSNAYSYGYRRGFSSTGAGATGLMTINSANPTGQIVDLFTLGTGNNVMVLEIPSITGSSWRSFRGAFAGNYWPAMETLTQHQSYTLTGTIVTTGVTPQSLGVFLGAMRATSATALTVKFARLRIDLLL